MIQGRVTHQYEAIIMVELLAQDQQRYQIEAMIDTGFNGYLTLPFDVIHRLEMPFAGHRCAMLGDGRTVVFDVYLGTIWWHDQVQDILVFQADGGPLFGMALLAGNRVTLDVVEDGTVLIERLGGTKQV